MNGGSGDDQPGNRIMRSLEISAPVEVQAKEKQYTLRFTVTATKDKLRELKAFLDNGGYKYE